MQLKSATLLLCLAVFAAQLSYAADSPLQLLQRTELADYTGDFDHFGVDLDGKRLFLAGEDGGTVEVFNLISGAHLKTLEGFETPHAIHYFPSTKRLIVTDSGDGLSKVVDGETYKIIDTLKLIPGADVMEYDPNTGHVWIVAGGKNGAVKLPQTSLYEVDPSTGEAVGKMVFDSDFTEAMAFEQNGKRAFINVTRKNQIAVIDPKTHTVTATWPVLAGELNAPMALDEANHRLFVVTRQPFKLVVINTDSGAEVASFAVPERTNGLMFDEANHRIYAAGDNHIAVFEQKNPDQYLELEPVASAIGAKTGILVPELNRLYLAVSPGEGVGGALLMYQVAGAGTGGM